MILLVYTSGHAFRIEKELKKLNIPCSITPIPRNVSSDCGICLRFSPEDRPAVESVVSAMPFEIQGIVEGDAE